jgi:hypothetical protein
MLFNNPKSWQPSIIPKPIPVQLEIPKKIIENFSFPIFETYGYFGGTVRVPCLVGKIMANFLEHMRGNFTEVDFIRLILSVLARTREHGLYCV